MQTTYIFPNDRLSFGYLVTQGSPLYNGQGRQVIVTTDAQGNFPAAITDLSGNPIANSILTVGPDSLLPFFYGPPGVTTLYGCSALRTPGEDVIQMDARLSDRVNSIATNGQIVAYSVSGVLSTSVGDFPLYNDTTGIRTITSIRASVGSSPSGSPVIVDVLNGGASIFGGNSPLIINPGSNTVVYTNAANFNNIVEVGDSLTVNITAVGSTFSGSDLVVQVTWM